ncbi:hypothetical protein MASR2M78_04120 [Treponema sp.]
MRKREIQAAIVLSEDDTDGQILSYSASSKGREGWHKRLESGRGNCSWDSGMPSLKKLILPGITVFLVADADDGLLLWEAVRRCPEGLTAGLVRSDTAAEALLALCPVPG